MEATALLLPTLRYLVYADRQRRHLLAAFASVGEARQYLHLLRGGGGPAKGRARNLRT